MGLSWVGLCAVGRWRSGPSQDGASLKGHHTTHRHTRLALNQTARRHHRCALRFHNKLTSTSPSLASTLKPESNDRSPPPIRRAGSPRVAAQAQRAPFSFAAKEASSRRERIRQHLQRRDRCPETMGFSRKLWGRPPLSISHLGASFKVQVGRILKRAH